jgi:hypothetical protein
VHVATIQSRLLRKFLQQDAAVTAQTRQLAAAQALVALIVQILLLAL